MTPSLIMESRGDLCSKYVIKWGTKYFTNGPFRLILPVSGSGRSIKDGLVSRSNRVFRLSGIFELWKENILLKFLNFNAGVRAGGGGSGIDFLSLIRSDFECLSLDDGVLNLGVENSSDRLECFEVLIFTFLKLIFPSKVDLSPLVISLIFLLIADWRVTSFSV